MRDRFNTDRIWERVQTGELIGVVEDERPALPIRGQPPGTTSVLMHIYTPSAQKVAVVHFFRLPDGKVGASGKVDPKKLHVDGEIWQLER